MRTPPLKVLCISDRAYLAFDQTGELRKPQEDERLEESLTVGKIYEVLNERLGMYAIIDDTGGKYLFPKSRFQVIDE